MSWVSLTDDALAVSLEAPVGWSRSATEAFPVQLRAPEEEGFRATCGLSHERFDPPTPEGLTTFIARTAEALARDYEEYRLEEHRNIVVDNRPGSLITYTWTPPSMGRRLRQVLGLLVVEPGLLLELDGAALDNEAVADTVDAFGHILASLRFL